MADSAPRTVSERANRLLLNLARASSTRVIAWRSTVPPTTPCRADDYEQAHFDTRQYNHIVWRTADELRERLHTRIKVLIG